MDLISLLILVIVFGLLYWALTLLPLPQPFRNIALVILILIFILVLLGMVGVLPGYHVRLR